MMNKIQQSRMKIINLAWPMMMYMILCAMPLFSLLIVDAYEGHTATPYTEQRPTAPKAPAPRPNPNNNLNSQSNGGKLVRNTPLMGLNPSAPSILSSALNPPPPTRPPSRWPTPNPVTPNINSNINNSPAASQALTNDMYLYGSLRSSYYCGESWGDWSVAKCTLACPTGLHSDCPSDLK